MTFELSLHFGIAKSCKLFFFGGGEGQQLSVRKMGHDNQHNDIQHNDIQHNDIQHNQHSIITFSIIHSFETFSIMRLFARLFATCSITVLSAIMLRVMIFYYCAESGSVKANGREPKTGLGRVFNSKLGCIAAPGSKGMVCMQPLLKL
jgi:hypothetical protein